jgi:O-antigen/teichoic acid export membrane protein
VRPSPGTIRALGARGAAIGAGFLLTVLVARGLPVGDAGGFFLIYTLLAVAATVGRLGTDTLALKLAGDETGSPPALRHVWVVALGGSLVSAALLVVGLWLSGVVPLSPLVAAALGAAGVGQALSVLAGAVLRAHGRLVAGILAELGALPALSTVVIFGVWLIVPPTLDSALLLFSLCSVITAAWAVPLALRVARPAAGDPGTLGAFLRAHGRSLAAMMAVAVLVFVVAWAPVFVLSIAGRLADIALFTVAARLANLITLVPNVQVSALAPRFAALYRTGDLGGVSRLARASARWATAIVLVPAGLVVVFAEPVIRLAYGDGLRAAAPALAILAVAALVTVALGQVSQLMLLGGLEGRAFWLTSAVVAVWATAGVALAYGAGVTGIAILAAITTVAYFATSALLLARRGIRSTV